MIGRLALFMVPVTVIGRLAYSVEVVCRIWSRQLAVFVAATMAVAVGLGAPL